MVKIEVFADIACPWCYIGERRLRRVLQARGVEAEVRWRPYELQRGMPSDGVPWSDFVERKFGGWERARPMFAQVQAAASGEGIRFDFERVASAPNTRGAHRVILMAEERGKGMEAAEALFAAYFTEGRDVGDPAVLAEIGASVGLDAAAVRDLLASDHLVAEVEESEAVAERSGVTGVPLFVFDERYGISGAQPEEVFTATLDRVLAEAAG